MERRGIAAVVVNGACKHYGKPGKPDYKPVLMHLNMTVERGTIYGLLGPSGCGKTTLLSALVGRRKLDAGDVWVLGGKPGERGSGVPGPRIGYMPQDIALVGEFTVRDAMMYFGRIHGMDPRTLKERSEFLISLLELPSPTRFVKHLSGGQQRRVSLAAALIHEPELLILDEPTVGLDPVLRERIWEYLSELARGGATVIITTHYIDETKQAHRIGMLRDGFLLAENTPEEILREFNADTLEEAFLKLAMKQAAAPSRHILSSSPDVIPESSVTSVVERRNSSRESFNICTSSTDVLTKSDPEMNNKGKSKNRYHAVLIKCLQQFARHPGGLLFSIFFPIIQVVAFFSAVGHDPIGLHIAVVNDEAGSSIFGSNICHNESLVISMPQEDESCHLNMLSCSFLKAMEENNIFQTSYESLEAAMEDVKIGKLYGAMYFPSNFTESLSQRIKEGEIENVSADTSTINVWLDMSNHQVALYIKTKLYETYKSFAAQIMLGCGKPENMIKLPVRFGEPVYGRKDPEMVSFMAPGIMITINFFLPAIVTATLMISDRLEGVWERSVVAGVKPHEMLNVHIGLQTIVIVVQTMELMLVAFLCYGLSNRGSIGTVYLLLFLQGLSGMCYGFLLSVVCTSHTLAFFIATGSFYPMILLCGILWPLEGMSTGLRFIALTLPFTVPSSSLREIMEKGFTLFHPEVYQGFIITIAWIVATLMLCFLSLKYLKRYS